MGSTGRGSDIDYVTSAGESGEYQELYRDVLKPEHGWDEPVLQWFEENSNITDWTDKEMTPEEKDAVRAYTGSSFRPINDWQYTIPWEKMDAHQRGLISDMHNGLSKFVLNKGIVVDRGCDFQIFGKGAKQNMSMTDIYNFLKGSNGVVQNDGFMSFSANRNGEAVNGKGLIIRLRIPPSVGAGGYVDHFSHNDGEREFVLNNNAILKFDYRSMYQDSNGKIHINADWLGRARAQTISDTNKSKLRKK